MNVSSSNVLVFFFYKRKTPYELRISDWSSDVCSSDLTSDGGAGRSSNRETAAAASITWMRLLQWRLPAVACSALRRRKSRPGPYSPDSRSTVADCAYCAALASASSNTRRSEGHTSELQSLMRTSYAVSCLKKNKNTTSKSTD